MAGYTEYIAKMRQEGALDDDIVSAYREDSPHASADIDRMLREGASATDIVDVIAESPAAQATQANPQVSEGFLEKTGKALQYGLAQAGVGLGRTAHYTGKLTGLEAAKKVGAYLEDGGKSIAPENYKPASQDFFEPREADKGIGGFGWGYLPRMLLESSPGLAADLGAGALTGGAGFIASNAARNLGPAIDARVANNGGRDPTASDYAMAAGSAALQAGLNRVGINPAISGVTKGAGLAAISQIPAGIAKAGAVDAAAGAAGNIVDQIGVTAGTEKGLTISPHEAIGSGVSSGAMGGAVRGARGVGDVVNAVRFRGMDDAVGNRLADRIQGMGIEPKTPKDAHQALRVTEDALKRDSDVARSEVFDRLSNRDGDAREAVHAAESLLNNGRQIEPGRFDQLRQAIGGTPHGDRLISAMEERSALNLVKSTGRYDDQAGTFAGGLSATPFVNDTLNPLSWLTDRTKRAIGGLAGVGLAAEVPFITKAVASGMLPKALALQAAAYGAIRGVDAVTGSRQPLGQFLNRYSGRSSVPALAGAPFPLPEAGMPAKAPAESTSASQGRAGRAGLSAVSEALSDSPSPGKSTPVMVEAMRADDRAANAGLSAVERAFRTDEGATGNGRPSGGSEKTVDGHQGDSGYMGSSEGLKGADESLRSSSGRSEAETISSSSGRYSVDRTMDGVSSRKRYVARTREHLDTRAKFGDELEAVAPNHSAEIETLINRLNKHARSAELATSMIEDTIVSLPLGLQSAAWDAFIKHQSRISATYPR